MRQPIKPSTLAFLKSLAANNNREWFAARKDQYLVARENAFHFFESLAVEMNRHDRVEPPILFRIYNDVRFSKDKTPYDARFAGYLRRVKPMLRGGYYVWIRPGGSRIGCGFAYPAPDDLKRIRQDIDNNYADWRKILRAKALTTGFGNMQGDKVKSAPRGFSKDHPAIDLLRFKQYWFERKFSNREVLQDDFAAVVARTYKALRPFLNHMSEVLTTDMNGELIV